MTQMTHIDNKFLVRGRYFWLGFSLQSDFVINYLDDKLMCQRIMCPKKEIADIINYHVLNYRC